MSQKTRSHEPFVEMLLCLIVFKLSTGDLVGQVIFGVLGCSCAFRILVSDDVADTFKKLFANKKSEQVNQG